MRQDPVRRGLSQFARRDSRRVGKTLYRREIGTVPLALREGRLEKGDSEQLRNSIYYNTPYFYYNNP